MNILSCEVKETPDLLLRHHRFRPVNVAFAFI